MYIHIFSFGRSAKGAIVYGLRPMLVQRRPTLTLWPSYCVYKYLDLDLDLYQSIYKSISIYPHSYVACRNARDATVCAPRPRLARRRPTLTLLTSYCLYGYRCRYLYL